LWLVYILQSKISDKIYIGFTTNIKARVSRHNQGKELSTKAGRPWKLIYFEAYASKKLALRRERKLKHYGKSLAMLKKRIGL